MKKILVSILFISSGQMHTAQFARKLGRFLCAPSIGIGIVAAGKVLKVTHDDIHEFLNQPSSTDKLDPDFLESVQDEAKRRNLKNVDVSFSDFNFGAPNMASSGDSKKSKIIVYSGSGLSNEEKNILQAKKQRIITIQKHMENTPWWLPDIYKKWETSLLQEKKELDDMLLSLPSLDQTLCIAGHELSHIQANDSRSCMLVASSLTMLPFVSWRAARLSGRGRLISLGAAGLSGLIGTFANSLFRKSREYKADYNASTDAQILEAGAQMMDKAAKSKQLIKQRLLENFKKFRSGSKLSEKEKKEMLRDIIDLFSGTIEHPDPAKRAERLRARAQELREQNK